MDPRVSALLSRLGGLYRDPSRVDRDASSLLKSSVGQNLAPNISPLVENNGDSHNTLVLQGTIAMHFRGNTYQLLVDIYLPPGYPGRPPVAYVRLGAPNMYLKERHAHVGPDGHVYLPYLHEWRPHTHNLIELVVAMSSVFSADPPVFTRSTPPTAMSNTSYSGATSYSSAVGGSSSERDAIQQVEAALLREAEEASRREAEEAEAARRAAQEEEEMRTAQEAFEARKLMQVRQELTRKIRSYLTDLSQQTKRSLQSDAQDKQRLNRNQLEKQLEFLENLKSSLEKHHVTVDKATEDINVWLAEHRSLEENGEHGEPVSVDDLCVPSNVQMMDLSAENASLTDALYFLDTALHKGTLDLTTHLKYVRQLAKRQFLVRAHQGKIVQVLAMSGR